MDLLSFLEAGNLSIDLLIPESAPYIPTNWLGLCMRACMRVCMYECMFVYQKGYVCKFTLL